MISTHSKFMYGWEVTGTTKWIDFVVSSVNYSVQVKTMAYDPDSLAAEIESKMDAEGSPVTFTVSFDKSTRLFTIAGSGSFSLLFSTGANAANSICSIIGMAATDTTGTTRTSATATGTVYQTQFKLQDYVQAEDNVMSRFPSENVAASGKTTLIRFGTDRFYEFSFRYITDIFQSGSSPIRFNSTGRASIRAMMEWAIQKKPILFFPDESSTSSVVFILDTATGFKLKEGFNRNLIGYFDTDVLKWRVIE